MAKRKIVFRLEPDEVAIAWPVQQWDHLITVYRALAQEAVDAGDRPGAQSWIDAAAYIDEQVEQALKKDDWN